MLDGYTSAPQTFSHFEFLIGQMAIFNLKVHDSFDSLWKGRRSYAGASGQVSHHCSLHSLPGWLDVTVALIYCWFISSSYDFSLFSVFFPCQIYPSKLQHHWIKYHFVDLPSLKAINFYWSFIYLFDIYFIATTEPDQDMERTSVQHGQEFLHSEWNILCGLP